MPMTRAQMVKTMQSKAGPAKKRKKGQQPMMSYAPADMPAPALPPPGMRAGGRVKANSSRGGKSRGKR